ncbi:hypothetical protein ACFVYV_25015 [Streptomyces mirabilis]|uniref:hypothetical protein n=1 Tax=Streptomyces mirabilis TaxID=68239 RepID=UPI0036DC1B1B
MDRVTFTAKDISTLRQAARYLRAMELQLPDTAHEKTHLGVLTSAMWLGHQADELAAAPQPPSRETRRPIFNHLVAPEAGGPVFHVEAKAMLDTHEAAVRADADAALLRIKGAMLALHPKTANPRHGCCAPPTVCKGHRAECRSGEHTIGGQDPWPCKSLRAVGITSDADAQAVRTALAALERETDPHGYPSRKKVNRGRAVHATRQMDDGIGDAGACGMYFPRDTQSSLEDPDTPVSCQACVKALARKELADAELTAALSGAALSCGCPVNKVCESCGECGHGCRCGEPPADDAHRCKLPPNRRLPCGCCPHEICEDCERCAHKCECGGAPAK